MISPWDSNGTDGKRVVNGDGALFYDSWHARDSAGRVALSRQPFQLCSSLRWENFFQVQ
eukprot:COSAG01_NODE_62496_length_284_cov_0.843243_1_plen_58_part_01